LVETPDCLPVENENYDYIITWALFHHINPNKWKEFLDKFGKLLKKGGEIIIY
jgi:cyclopropane fatty-acyl-phospholipid synthase-like methyltransferase